jgi:hypothetical protein
VARDGVRAPRREVRRGDDERDVDRAVIGEVAVGRLTVLAERFAVVGREDDDQAGFASTRSQSREKPAERLIDEGDFAVIGPVPETAEIRLRRRVRNMGVEAMDPSEPRPRLAFYPSNSPLDDRVGGAFDICQAGEVLGAEIVVIDVEPVAQAKTCVERVSADNWRRVSWPRRSQPAGPRGR